MRVLFTTWAWPSHYHPAVPLAWALRAAGHEVRMTSQPALLPAMRASGLPCTAVGRDVDIAAACRTGRQILDRAGPAARPGPTPGRDRVRLSDLLADAVPGGPAGERPASLRVLRYFEDEAAALFRVLWQHSPVPEADRMMLFGEVADAMVDDLLALARSWRPDLIVFDPLTYAGPLVAKLVGVPGVRTMFGPDVAYFLDAARSLAPLLRRLGLSGEDVAMLGTATVDPCPLGLQFSDAIAPTRRIRVRHVPYPGLAEVPSWLPDRPARRRICLSWGITIEWFVGANAFLPGEVLRGCAKLADERDAELVLAITAKQRPLLPADLPPNVRVVESVPLEALLSTCDAFIHHGGGSTTLTAALYGLPQLILPPMYDQAATAVLLTAAGAGLTIAAAEVTASELLAAGHELLDNPGYRATAARIQREMADQPTPAQIVADLAALA